MKFDFATSAAARRRAWRAQPSRVGFGAVVVAIALLASSPFVEGAPGQNCDYPGQIAKIKIALQPFGDTRDVGSSDSSRCRRGTDDTEMIGGAVVERSFPNDDGPVGARQLSASAVVFAGETGGSDEAMEKNEGFERLSGARAGQALFIHHSRHTDAARVIGTFECANIMADYEVIVARKDSDTDERPLEDRVAEWVNTTSLPVLAAISPEVKRGITLIAESLNRQGACDEVGATPSAVLPSKTVYSTPKYGDAYHVEVPLPPDWERTGSTRPDFVEMYHQRQGQLEVVAAYRDRGGNRKTQSLAKEPLRGMFALRTDGMMNLVSTANRVAPPERIAAASEVALQLRHRALDQLETITRDMANQQPKTKTGEEQFRGTELDFELQLILHADGGDAGGRTPANYAGLKYIVRLPVVFVPGTGGSILQVNGVRTWPPSALWGLRRQKWKWTQDILGGVAGTGVGSRRFWDTLRPIDPPAAVPDVLVVDEAEAFRPPPDPTWLDQIGKAGAVVGAAAVDANNVFEYYALCAKGWGGCVYKGWLDRMAKNGYGRGVGLTLFPYDWRLSPGAHNERLNGAVKWALHQNYDRAAQRPDPSPPDFDPARPDPAGLQPSDKLVLMSHSQGGLLIRSYLGVYPERVDNTILMAPPNLGTNKTIKAVGTTGYGFDSPFLNAEVGKRIANAWPAVYFMFPVNDAGTVDAVFFNAEGLPIRDVFNDKGALLSEKLGTFVLCGLGIGKGYFTRGADSRDPDCAQSVMDQPLLDRIGPFFRSLPNPKDKHIRTTVVVGYDQPTIRAFRLSYMKMAIGNAAKGTTSITRDVMMDRGLLPAEALARDTYPVEQSKWLSSMRESYAIVPYFAEVISACGDNLVPRHRALLDGAQTLYVKGVGHGKMTEDAVTQDHVDLLLRGIQPAGERGDATACSSIPAPIGDGVEIKVYGSPANIHVYDAQNRHAGFTADGFIEQSIPGSFYNPEGPSESVWLPASVGPVRVVLEGIIDTGLDLRITASDGRTERRAEYLAVPETPNSKAEIRFDPAKLDASIPLLVDVDGDGRTDETREADALTTFVAPKRSQSSFLVRFLLGALGIGVIVLVLTVVGRRRARRARAAAVVPPPAPVAAPPAVVAPPVAPPPAGVPMTTIPSAAPPPPSAPPVSRFCTKCGGRRNPRAKFCPKCGTPYTGG